MNDLSTVQRQPIRPVDGFSRDATAPAATILHRVKVTQPSRAPIGGSKSTMGEQPEGADVTSQRHKADAIPEDGQHSGENTPHAERVLRMLQDDHDWPIDIIKRPAEGMQARTVQPLVGEREQGNATVDLQ
jgi:hypothetical protein